MDNLPKYIVDLDKYRENCNDITNAFASEWGSKVQCGYSVKTNHDHKIILYAHDKLGWNIEVVSPDEYHYVKSIGIKEEKIILNGPCKIELIKEMESVPYIINLDNYDEVCMFVAHYPRYDGYVGLRVNYNLESKCPGETTVGDEVSRFGIDVESEEFRKCLNLLLDNGIRNLGLHLHTSTKTRSLKVFQELAYKTVDIKKQTGVMFTFVDIGGGFFGGQKIPGKPTMSEYAKTICDVLKDEFNPEKTLLVLEPGASVLATCITYETRIINKRVIRGITVLTVDGSLLHINPFLYNRTQPFEVLNEHSQRPVIHKQIICGATCMENDRLAVLIDSEELCKDDVLSFKYAGAYTMSFNSNFILNPPKVEYV